MMSVIRNQYRGYRFGCNWGLILVCVVGLLAGCGTTLSHQATDQLTASDAVDRSVAEIDFSPLSGKKVFLDTQYIVPVKSAGFVNKEYIVSTIRQQIVGAGCLIQDTKETSEFVIEARVGTMGADGHSIVYGVPPNNLSTIASSVAPGVPPLPSIPEMAFVKKDSHSAAAKISVFAYDRSTKEAVWQSGIAKAESSARNMWFFGVGPFQRGEIYEGTKFAGTELALDKKQDKGKVNLAASVRGLQSEKTFERNSPPEGLLLSQGVIHLASLGEGERIVGRLTAIDSDAEDEHDFALVEGQGSDDNALFQIREEQLILKPDVDLAQIKKEKLKVRIVVKDAVSEFQQWFEIPVKKMGIQFLSFEEQLEKSSTSQSDSSPTHTSSTSTEASKSKQSS